jgi:Fe-S-cluster containining protein
VANLRILNMMHHDEWAPRRMLPRVLVREERAISPCDSCNGHCCEMQVELAIIEAVRIGLTLAIPVDSFVKTRPYTAHGRGYSIDPGHPVELDVGPSRLLFAHNELGQCHFLHRIAGRGRCVAYGFRPGICRLYPYSVAFDDGTRVAVGTTNLCPQGWLYDDNITQQVERDLAAWRRDIEQSKRFCEDWNLAQHTDRSLPAFLRFAVMTLGPMLGLDPQRLYPPLRRRLGERLHPEGKARKEPS